MNPHPVETARDADLRLSVAALQRAAQRARQIAAQTGTPLVVRRDGRLEFTDPVTGASATPRVAKPDAPSGRQP